MNELPTPSLLRRKAQALAAQGDTQGALQAFEQAIKGDPAFAQAFEDLDILLGRAFDLERAYTVWQRIAAATPGSPIALKKLAKAALQIGKTEEASASLKQACALSPDDAAVWAMLGSLYAETFQFELARDCLRRSLAIEPGHEARIDVLGWIANELGDTRAALSILDPGKGAASFLRRLRFALLLPQIYESKEDLNYWHERYAAELAKLHAELDAVCPDADQVFKLTQTNFLLAYQGGNQIVLQREYARLLRRLISRARPDLVETPRRIAPDRTRIRAVFVSGFFNECTVGHYFRSWIEDLPPDKFERVVIHTGAFSDHLTASLGARADRLIHHRGGVCELAESILSLQPDILIYPEVGMHSVNYLLANMRLAPVQCAAWGHPITTGSDLIDYYLTCAEMEPAGAEAHYVEKLACLPGLGTRYRLPDPGGDAGGRAQFSLPEDRHLYVCSQSLFKIHPENDDLYLDLLAADDKAVIVFFQAMSGAVTRAFAGRLARGMKQRGLPPRNQVKFLARQQAREFRAILAQADAVLDTAHWSGGNTSLDALSVGAPIVALPGEVMRARQSMAMLQALGVPELIAQSPADYVAIAMRLASNPGYRSGIRQRILDNRRLVFERDEPLLSLATQLEEIYETHRRGPR